MKAFEPPSLFLNDKAVAASGVAKEIIIDSLRVFVQQHKGIGPVVASRDLASGRIPQGFDPALFALIRNDYYPNRTGDVMLYPRQYWIWGSAIATHGMPYEYDRSVPLYFFGVRIPAQRLAQPTAPVDIAPTLARLLGLPLQNVDGVSLLP